MKIIGSIKAEDLAEVGIDKKKVEELRSAGTIAFKGGGAPIQFGESVAEFLADAFDMALDEGIAFLLSRRS